MGDVPFNPGVFREGVLCTTTILSRLLGLYGIRITNPSYSTWAADNLSSKYLIKAESSIDLIVETYSTKRGSITYVDR